MKYVVRDEEEEQDIVELWLEQSDNGVVMYGQKKGSFTTLGIITISDKGIHRHGHVNSLVKVEEGTNSIKIIG